MVNEITVDDMTCEGCEDIVEDAIEELAGIDSVDADREDDLVTVEGSAERDDIVEAIDMAGYDASA